MAKRTFISYCHETTIKNDQVRELADQLNKKGIDCNLDQYELSVPQGWPLWMETQIREAQYVLVICSETYYKRASGLESGSSGKGIKFESILTYQDLFDNIQRNEKIIPIVMSKDDVDFIPRPLQPYTYYDVSTKNGFDTLCRRINGQPLHQKPRPEIEINLPDGENLLDDKDSFEDNDDSIDTRTKVETGKLEVELTLNRDFNNFSSEDRQKIIKAIEFLIDMDGELRIKSIKRGSVKLTFELSPPQCRRLLVVAESGMLSDFGLDKVVISKARPAFKPQPSLIDSHLNHNYSFDNFIEGACNRLARSAGYAVASKPEGTAFNPLFIYGGDGLGKSHLVQAIGNEIKNSFPEKSVLYVSSEKFTHQFIDAVKNSSVNDFLRFCETMDVLIIEDVQFFSGKEKTQDVFFHIFNHLHQAGRQIIITSDKAPAEMQGIEQRLLSRFKWGLIVDLEVPSLETRIAILKKKIHDEGIEISDEVIEYLAYSIATNIRELEGALITLIAQFSLNKKVLTIDLARDMIDKFVIENARQISIDYIQKVVCDYFDLPIELLKSKTRKREIVQARQIAMYFAKKMTKSDIATIGTLHGGMNKRNVLYAYRSVDDLSKTDKHFKNYLVDIERKMVAA